jgi:hypothetical protein
MLKRSTYVGLLGLILLSVSSCDSKDDGAEPSGSTEATAAPKKATVDVGSEIVAATSKTSFREGKVTKLEGSKVTFEYGRPDKKTNKKPTQTVDKTKVWLTANPHAPKAGDHLVCKVSTTSWHPCTVKAIEGEVIKVEDHYGKAHNINKSAILKPDAATQANIKEFLAKEAKHRAFDKAFEAAGKPAKPATWVPKKGEKIVIHFVGTSWYGGTVVENKKDKGKVRIDWEGDTWDDRDVAPDEVAPQPTKPMDVKEGQFVIVRPKSATMRWEHTKIVSLADDAIEVINRDDSKRKVSKNDVIPIVP